MALLLKGLLSNLRWLLIPTSLIVIPAGMNNPYQDAVLVAKLHFKPFECEICGRKGFAWPNLRRVCQMRKCYFALRKREVEHAKG